MLECGSDGSFQLLHVDTDRKTAGTSQPSAKVFRGSHNILDERTSFASWSMVLCTFSIVPPALTGTISPCSGLERKVLKRARTRSCISRISYLSLPKPPLAAASLGDISRKMHRSGLGSPTSGWIAQSNERSRLFFAAE